MQEVADAAPVSSGEAAGLVLPPVPTPQCLGSSSSSLLSRPPLLGAGKVTLGNAGPWCNAEPTREA